MFKISPSSLQKSISFHHYGDVIMSAMASQNHQPRECLRNRLSKEASKLRITGLGRGIHRWPVNSPHKGPVTRKMFPFDDVIMGITKESSRSPAVYYSGLLHWHETIVWYAPLPVRWSVRLWVNLSNPIPTTRGAAMCRHFASLREVVLYVNEI